MIRHQELARLLPALGRMGVHTLLVTSGVIRLPKEWMGIPRGRFRRRSPRTSRRAPQTATYERILTNIDGCTVNIHWVITGPMLARRRYLEDILRFGVPAPEAHRIWASTYSPQVGEHSPKY